MFFQEDLTVLDPASAWEFFNDLLDNVNELINLDEEMSDKQVSIIFLFDHFRFEHCFPEQMGLNPIWKSMKFFDRTQKIWII